MDDFGTLLKTDTTQEIDRVKTYDSPCFSKGHFSRSVGMRILSELLMLVVLSVSSVWD